MEISELVHGQADLVIEAVSEDAALKLEIFQQVDEDRLEHKSGRGFYEYL